MTDAAIEITGLKKTYAPSAKSPAKVALDGVDLTIPAGSIFGLLGPNGAGKSTMINIMAGLVLKSEGRVKIWGFDQDVNPRQSRAAIGVMPQELVLDPFFTPRGALDVQAGLWGVPKSQRKTMELLDLVGLADKADAYARSLSGGMRRRLLLAKALVHSPRVLVLDEPTAGVDIELRNMLWRNVRKLNEQQGTTIILTTHYLEEAQEMCDEIAIIDQGRVITRDTTANLVGRVSGKTLVVTPDGPAAIPALPEGVTVTERAGGTLAFTYDASKMGAGAVLDAIRAGGMTLMDVKTEEADLEDVFLQLTSKAGEPVSAA
ncbi:ABC transporter ATP-binding protein [Limimaricola litoreus]|uniref:ABC transporter ATP-binding protein n=1 Tax=Limimaricola litoreus TaxID=2955316 RepID=A0A9X2JNF2_9RHOB|nr:ABC transporter ATP-binding protein [Limimaricola litoreus]MCP1168747.1 ABC transporter ATP-binding protein [Limimaricola litoreus]